MPGFGVLPALVIDKRFNLGFFNKRINMTDKPAAFLFVDSLGRLQYRIE
jgi:hypothetical protein